MVIGEVLGQQPTERLGVEGIAAGLETVNPKTLTERLRLLQQQGIIARTAYAEVPPRVGYALTDRGRTLEPILAALWRWGAEDLGPPTGPQYNVPRPTEADAAQPGMSRTPLPIAITAAAMIRMRGRGSRSRRPPSAVASTTDVSRRAATSPAGARRRAARTHR